MAYGDFKNFTRRTDSDKILPDKAYNPNYDRCQRGLASMVYKVFNKRLQVVLVRLRLHCQRR